MMQDMIIPTIRYLDAYQNRNGKRKQYSPLNKKQNKSHNIFSSDGKLEVKIDTVSSRLSKTLSAPTNIRPSTTDSIEKDDEPQESECNEQTVEMDIDSVIED